jgi:hypothetical protein
MNVLKAILATLAFVIVYGFVDWFAGVTAPVLGPIVLAGMIVGLFALMRKIYKDGM